MEILDVSLRERAMPNHFKVNSISDINQYLVKNGVESVVSYLIGNNNYHKNGCMLSMANYRGGKGNSFQMHAFGDHAGNWFENNLNDLPNGKGMGDLFDFWMLNRSLNYQETVHEIQNYLGMNSNSQQKMTLEKAEQFPVSSDYRVFNSIDMNKEQFRLKHNKSAQEYLLNRGLSTNTIDYFQLGLSLEYEGKDGQKRGNALVFPILSPTGYFKRFAYYNIENITLNPINGNGWCPGPPSLACNTLLTKDHQYLFVVEGFKDLWILHQKIQGSDLANKLLIVTSTHGSSIPFEIKNNPSFFDLFDKIFLGHDSDKPGELIAASWSFLSKKLCYRVAPTFSNKYHGKDWTDFFLNNRNGYEEFVDLLTKPELMKPSTSYSQTKKLQDYKAGEIIPFPTLDVTSAYEDGLMYYSIKVLQITHDGDGYNGASAKIKVIRSDKSILNVLPIKNSNSDSNDNQPIFCLDDGTILKKEPQSNSYSSWDWSAIKDWLDGKKQPRALSFIVDDIALMLKKRVWLSNEDDYVIIALTMVLTYVQEVFEAVPFLFAVGVAGSGKTELGRILSSLGFNALLTGDISHATLSRVIDQTRGFLIIDDAEKLQKVEKKGNSSNESLLQILKVSYKKSTAIRQITEMKGNSGILKEFSFYGVKLFTNTSGMESILGTRTIRIQLRKAPSDFKQSDIPFEVLKSIRSELHAWAMENASRLSNVYNTYQVSNREDEITTPFRVFAESENKSEWSKVVDRLLLRMRLHNNEEESGSLVGYLKEAMFNIANAGFITVTLEHVILEMHRILPMNFGKNFTSEVPEWTQNLWVKKNLQLIGFLEESKSVRVRVAKANYPLQRTFKLSQLLFQELKSDNKSYGNSKGDKQIDGKDYCRIHKSCASCPYKNAPCQIRENSKK